jgi:hypothetical protein
VVACGVAPRADTPASDRVGSHASACAGSHASASIGSAIAVVQTYESDAFGVPITASGGSSQPFGITGEQRDPGKSLVYLRARYDDPVPGRFIVRLHAELRKLMNRRRHRLGHDS